MSQKALHCTYMCFNLLLEYKYKCFSKAFIKIYADMYNGMISVVKPVKQHHIVKFIDHFGAETENFLEN